MVLYKFLRPIPIAELDAELRQFARAVREEGPDTVAGLQISLEHVRAGEPFQLVRPGSDIPISRVIFESRLARPRRNT